MKVDISRRYVASYLERHESIPVLAGLIICKMIALLGFQSDGHFRAIESHSIVWDHRLQIEVRFITLQISALAEWSSLSIEESVPYQSVVFDHMTSHNDNKELIQNEINPRMRTLAGARLCTFAWDPGKISDLSNHWSQELLHKILSDMNRVRSDANRSLSNDAELQLLGTESFMIGTESLLQVSPLCDVSCTSLDISWRVCVPSDTFSVHASAWMHSPWWYRTCKCYSTLPHESPADKIFSRTHCPREQRTDRHEHAYDSTDHGRHEPLTRSTVAQE